MTPRRYAEWRPVAVRRIPAQWIGMALGAVVAAPLIVFARFGGYGWIVLGGFVAHWATTRLTERRLQNLRDDPEGSQFAVTLRLRREVDYAFDEGLLAFVDGWLVYSGRQCSFSLRHEDARGMVVETKRHGFLFEGPAGRHAALFEAAEPGRLGGALKAWTEARDVPGAPVFPPVVPNDEARTLHRLWLVAGLLPCLVLLASALIQTKLYERVLLDLFALAVLPVAAFYGAQAQRALARIAAGLPYRRNRFARLLGIRPMHAAPTAVRSTSVKSQAQIRADRFENARWAERSKAVEVSRLEAKRLEAQAGRTLAREMLDHVRANALPSAEKSGEAAWEPDADGVLRPKGQTP